MKIVLLLQKKLPDLARLTVFFRLWLVVFVFALASGLLIQLFILPVLLPKFHACHGLLAGNDVAWFHGMAVDLAERIDVNGWKEWTLRPAGQAPSGIMAVAYVFFPDEPWVVLPLYAALFATSIAVLSEILSLCGFRRTPAVLGVLPLVVFPSSALLYAIPHKDAFSVCGSMLFLYGLLSLSVLPKGKGGQRGLIFLGTPVFVGLFGIFLVWVVRPYAVHILMGASVIVALAATLFFLIGFFQHRFSEAGRIRQLVVLWLLIVLLNFFWGGSVGGKASDDWVEKIEAAETARAETARAETARAETARAETARAETARAETARAETARAETARAETARAETARAETARAETARAETARAETARAEKVLKWDWWEKSWFLPHRVDVVLRQLAELRIGYISDHFAAASAIDLSVKFHGCGEMAYYLPRAVQIGLFAPFPTDWIKRGSMGSGPGTIMRQLSGFEMLLWYIVFIFWVVALIRGPERLAIGLLSLYAVSATLVFVFSIPNVGTLYRMRIGFWMLLFSVAVAMAVTVYEGRGKCVV